MKSKKKIILPKLNKANYSKKKYKYKLSYNSKRRRLALDEGIKSESKKKGSIFACTPDASHRRTCYYNESCSRRV